MRSWQQAEHAKNTCTHASTPPFKDTPTHLVAAETLVNEIAQRAATAVLHLNVQITDLPFTCYPGQGRRDELSQAGSDRESERVVENKGQMCEKVKERGSVCVCEREREGEKRQNASGPRSPGRAEAMVDESHSLALDCAKRLQSQTRSVGDDLSFRSN
jgi:hypothetical protein